MTFAEPLWLLLLPLWLLVPFLDRMARPKETAALPLAQLPERGLRAQLGSLPWLSVHGLAFLLVVFALAGPGIPTREGWLRQPDLYLVTVADPASAVTGAKRFQEVVERLAEHPMGVVHATPAGPVLAAPLTTARPVLTGLWPEPAKAPVARDKVARALVMASAKAPKGAWLIVIGGRSGPEWGTALALAANREQQVAHLDLDSPASALPLAYRAGLHDADAVSGLRFALEEVSRETPIPGAPLPLARYCLGAALAILVLGWYWRQFRWQAVAP